MEKLPKELNRNGFIYKFHKRGDRALIYEQYDPEVEKTIAFEVFKIKVDQPKFVFGSNLPEREVFPSNEDFGKWAWACSKLERALYRFDKLESGEEIEH
jgi:hypothetical protein